VNEEQDPSMIIARLRKEIETLKNEIKLLRGYERGPLSTEEKSECTVLCKNFVDNRDMN